MTGFVKMIRLELALQSPILKKTVLPNLTVSRFLLAAIMILSLSLNLYNLRTVGDANAYYTAAVKAMLQSRHNFFFVAAEPGGAVSVDKPPLGLWIEAGFAYFFGASGFSLSLPNILAGVLEIPILYFLVKKYMGELAGLAAALVMALTPVFVATHRHNTLDGMLVLTLLLAAWAFVYATESGKLRWALLGGVIIGIGFNIKMGEALLPLPAFYTLYFLGSKEGWLRKTLNLILSSAVLAAVSLSWAVIVDNVPAGQRPFVGSTITDQVTELIFQHNGVDRLFNITPPQLGISKGQSGVKQILPPLPKFNGTGLSYQEETGKPGIFRFFIPPLSKQLSWLLPFALISLLILLFSARIHLPVESVIHKALILWGVWLVTCLVFFSIISGIFHAYYIIVMVPALSATVGLGFAQIWNLGRDKKMLVVLFVIAAITTLAFQRSAITQYKDRIFLINAAGVLLYAGSFLLLVRRRTAYVTIFLAMLVIPAYWTLMTAISNANQTFPSAYVGGSLSLDSHYAANDPNVYANQRLLAYLQSNTQDVKYLVAVPSSTQGVPLVLTSERPVLYIGGFGGLDPVIDVNGLKELVAKGDLRYVLYAPFFRRPSSTGRGDPEILDWLKTSCLVVTDFSKVIVYTRRPRQQTALTSQNQNNNSIVSGPRNDYLTLYLCP